MRANCSLEPASLISMERWADFSGNALQDQDSQVSRKKRRGTTRVQNRGIANASLEVGCRGRTATLAMRNGHSASTSPGSRYQHA